MISDTHIDILYSLIQLLPMTIDHFGKYVSFSCWHCQSQCESECVW